AVVGGVFREERGTEKQNDDADAREWIAALEPGHEPGNGSVHSGRFERWRRGRGRQPLIQQIGCTHGRSRHLRTLRGRWRRTRGHRWFGRGRGSWRGGRRRRLTLLGSGSHAGEALLEIRDLLI